VQGWAISVSRTMADRVRAAIDYTQVSARWGARSVDEPAIMRVAHAAVRKDEGVHDVTASVETGVEATATRVSIIYKVSDGFSARDSASVPRFDVQVTQGLPFLNFTNARWEMLVAVRTLYREDPLDASVYDELLVVRPPKRVLGGVAIRF
jgi:hypothetical protein